MNILLEETILAVRTSYREEATTYRLVALADVDLDQRT